MRRIFSFLAMVAPLRERLRGEVLPTLYLIAPDGTMVSRHAGPLQFDQQQEIAAHASIH